MISKWHAILWIPIVTGCGAGLVEEQKRANSSVTSSSVTSLVEQSAQEFATDGQSLPDLRLLDDIPELERVFAITDRIYTGSEPRGEAAFAALKRLGVRAVVSVDGIPPDAETARRHGLRTIHIPIGYDGIPELARRSLELVIREIDGPIYVHCHHGRHRGPAAAAVACIASGAATPDEARKILTRAETGKNYQGLWRDVADYVPAPDSTDEPILVERAEVDVFALSMASIGRAFDHLEGRLKTQIEPGSSTFPSAETLGEALLLREGFAEAKRSLTQSSDAERSTEFMAWLDDSLELATSFESALTQQPDHARKLFLSIKTQCQLCHATYRDK